MFSFRALGQEQRALWAAYPLTSLSKSALFAQAERISDDALRAFLAEQID